MSQFRRDAGYEPTCVVAGGGPGLNLAIAGRYAKEGFVSFVLLRRPERTASIIEALREQGLNVISIACDVLRVSSIAQALRKVKGHSGRFDVLIYNALASSDHLAGALTFVNETVDEMRDRGDGAILFSGFGQAELRALVDRLADNIKRDGIRVAMVTIDGTMPAQDFELEKIAELFWQLFIASERSCPRELRFP